MSRWLIIVIIGLWLWLVYIIFQGTQIKLNQKFYQPSQICTQLNQINFSLPEIRREVRRLHSDQLSGLWLPWPELDLYEDQTKEWQIFPFIGFDKIMHTNCDRCQVLWRFF